MTRFNWKHAVLCAALVSAMPTVLQAQNATTGGDQRAQPDAQTSAGQGGMGGGRRGGGVRGTVTSVSGSNIVVKNEQGETWTVVTTDNTRVRLDGQPAAVSAVKPGDEAIAVGMPDNDKHEVHAMMVVDASAAMVAKAKANMGKTYINGRITAINETQLTIMRPDHVSQVISLDEGTSLHKGGRMTPAAMQAAGMSVDTGMMGGMGGGRRSGQGGASAAVEGGEAITLADVKVGEFVIGVGSVKDGSFVPTDLLVQQRPAGGGPGMGGGRRGGMNGGGGDAPPSQ
jgi:hypothetical protein